MLNSTADSQLQPTVVVNEPTLIARRPSSGLLTGDQFGCFDSTSVTDQACSSCDRAALSLTNNDPWPTTGVDSRIDEFAFVRGGGGRADRQRHPAPWDMEELAARVPVERVLAA